MKVIQVDGQCVELCCQRNSRQLLKIVVNLVFDMLKVVDVGLKVDDVQYCQIRQLKIYMV